MSSKSSSLIHPWERPGAALRLALWFGLVTGLAEVVLLGIRKFALHRFLFLSLDWVWMTPLANALLFLVAGLVLIVVRVMLPRKIPLPSVMVFAGLGTFSLFLMYDPLSKPAALILALGIGIQAARMAPRHWNGFMRVVRWTIPIMAVVVLLAGIGVRTWFGITSRRSQGPVTGLAPAAPNVLLIVLDTVRAWSLGLYGYSRPTTPELARWMADGVRFQTALATAPWTLPSHATLFTGRYPHELSAGWMTPLDDEYPTLAEVLSAQGYGTAGFVANTTYAGYESGLNRGFSHYEDYQVTLAQVIFSSTLGKYLAGSRFTRRKLLRLTAEDINDRFLGWLDSRSDSRPFFVFLNYLDAHSPYQPPPPYDTLFSDNTGAGRLEAVEEGAPARRWTPEQLRVEVSRYDESVAYMDGQLGTLFTELKRRGMWDNTLVIITSDHGEEFGEHRVFFHGNSLYRAALDVPLLIRYPARVPGGQVIRTPVSLKDLAATVLDLSGNSSRLPGRSLARFWNGTTPDSGKSADTLLMELDYSRLLPKRTPIARGSMKSVMLGGYRLIRNGDGVLELYDFRVDSLEVRDLAKDSTYQTMLNGSVRALQALAP